MKLVDINGDLFAQLSNTVRRSRSPANSNERTLAITIGSYAAMSYRVGMPVCIGVTSRKLHHRIWRWLTKRNTRIARIDGGTVYLERCR